MKNFIKTIYETSLSFKLLFLFIIILLSNNKTFGQCGISWVSISPVPICVNVPSIPLNPFANPVGGSFYCTTAPSSITQTLGVYYFNPSIAGPGIHTIGYAITTPFPGCSLTTNVTVSDYIKINPLPNVSGTNKYMLTSGTSMTLTVFNPLNYTNFHWYENGFEVGITSSLTVSRMGTFTVLADGPCGIKEKAELEVVCDCGSGDQAYANGFTFTQSTTTLSASSLPHTTTDYVFGGTIIIAKNAELRISNANIDIKPCTKIIIESGDPNILQTGGKFFLGTNARLRGCDKWQGIIVNGVASENNTNVCQGKVFIATQDAEVSDAFIAVYSNSGGQVELNNGKYSNNNTDIVLMNYSFDYSPTLFRKNTFKGTWIHDNINSLLCNLDPIYNSFINSTNRSSFKQMVYLENVKEFDIYDCTFIGNDFLDGANYKVNAIELNNVSKINLGRRDIYPYPLGPIKFTGYFNSGIYGRSVTNILNNSPDYLFNRNYLFDKYTFDSKTDLNKGIDLENCSNIQLGSTQAVPFDANRFLGKMNYGIYVSNCSNITQYENLFNVNNVTSIIGLGSSITNGMYYKNCNKLNITGNWMASITNGGYFENCTNNSIVNVNHLKALTNGLKFKDCQNIAVSDNVFNGCTNNSLEYYGTLGSNYISGNHFIDANYGLIISPTQNPLGALIGTNSNSSIMNINIECNQFKNNEYAIVGSGNIVDQGNSSGTNGNKFDLNKQWDLAWMDYDIPSTNWFKYFGNTASTGATPNPSLVALMYSPITLNGSVINLGANNYQPFNTSINASCFSALKIATTSNDIKVNTDEVKILNSVVKEEITISKFPNNLNSINCFDAMGRIFSLELISYENDTYRFNAQNLAAGIYYITLNNVYLKFYKL